MTSFDAALDQLAPDALWSPDWDEVLARAEVRPTRHFYATRRPLLVLAVVLTAVLIPLVALAASRSWWFFNTPGAAPEPTHAPVVVHRGVWDGHPWELVAYPSTTDGLCWAVTPLAPTQPNGVGSALACAPFSGVPGTPETKPSPDMTITYLHVGASQSLPGYIAGPVIESATTVEIHLVSGQTVRTDTVPAPEPLGHVRFYATQLPDTPPSSPRRNPISWVAGLDATGKIVACVAPSSAVNGISPTSACGS